MISKELDHSEPEKYSFEGRTAKNMTSRRGAKCNVSIFANDRNARMQTVLREFVCM